MYLFSTMLEDRCAQYPMRRTGDVRDCGSRRLGQNSQSGDVSAGEDKVGL